jgi:hypothetical protein
MRWEYKKNIDLKTFASLLATSTALFYSLLLYNALLMNQWIKNSPSVIEKGMLTKTNENYININLHECAKDKSEREEENQRGKKASLLMIEM